ncbi:MAG TPA: hypothetical protein VEK34_03075 [Methylocella sp.]|nr:hypothetical protein [Methylocella sp.]
MKLQLSFTTLWLTPALAMLAIVTLSLLPSSVVHKPGLARLAAIIAPIGGQNPCMDGRAQYSKVHGGMVCPTGLLPQRN